LRYIQTGASGYFYPWSNPNNFLRSGDITQSNTSGLATSGNLETTGTALQNQFNNYYLKSNPNNFSSSGNVENTGTALQNQINNIKENTGVFIQNGNLNGLISTGSSDLRYLNTGSSGYFYPWSNPNQFIKSGDVNNISGSLQQNLERSGGYLFGLINASSAGVSSINSASGAITINGAGNVSIITAGQTITVSGNTGEYINFYKTSNPNNFSTSGNVENTGTSLQNQITSIKGGTGVFIQLSNLNGLISTGAADLRYLQTGVSGEFLKNNNLVGLISTGDLAARNYISTGNADLRYLQTGVSGEFLKNSNLNGLANSGNFVSGISVTGGLGIRNDFNINAGNNISLSQQGLHTLQINATIPAGFATSGNIESTGTALQFQKNENQL